MGQLCTVAAACIRLMTQKGCACLQCCIRWQPIVISTQYDEFYHKICRLVLLVYHDLAGTYTGIDDSMRACVCLRHRLLCGHASLVRSTSCMLHSLFKFCHLFLLTELGTKGSAHGIFLALFCGCHPACCEWLGNTFGVLYAERVCHAKFWQGSVWCSPFGVNAAAPLRCTVEYWSDHYCISRHTRLAACCSCSSL